jgi:hypothetical protein
MVTFRCRSCGTEQELPFGSDWFFCDDECYGEFTQVVGHLMRGGDPEEMVDLQSRLFCEAVREVQARRRAERVFARDVREREFQSSKPRPLRAIYPC